MNEGWDETPKASSITIVVPHDADVEKADIEKAIDGVLPDGMKVGNNEEPDSTTDDTPREFKRGYGA
jgi:hypothetical protein